MTYTINNLGAVKVNQKMVADKSKKVSEMFRFGMQFRMPLAFNEIEYYGRGPVENYSDRNHAAMLGKYRRPVQIHRDRPVFPLYPSAGNRHKNRYPLVETVKYRW